jgi:membrane-bound ClpP family serine protease
MLTNILKGCLLVGVLLIIIGVILIVFTDVTMGMNGILMVSLIIGLLLSIPSKIVLTFLYLQKKEQNQAHSSSIKK